jgi:hypothetical protein
MRAGVEEALCSARPVGEADARFDVFFCSRTRESLKRTIKRALKECGFLKINKKKKRKKEKK